MTLPETVMLLDIDGVINVKHPGWRNVRQTCIPDSNGDLHYMKYSPRVIYAIKRLHNSGLVDIQWASSWVNDPEALERIWSLPKFKCAFPSCWAGGLAEKTHAARRIVANGRKLIWVDETCIPKFGPVYDELTANGRSLLISPENANGQQSGLQPAHFAQIWKFLDMKEIPYGQRRAKRVLKA